ncbi:MAG: PAS domain S-box protein [Planctomycetaceae bacterium]|jgi:two-component system, sensor histidine kinase and response regulator|nr:PAS domain S-box protein [Planctomycetaceae bacterium]MBT6483537.1 PAS domain S-box protein [Planctomycetaceae bacterium]MBT6494879.1 PAS domain S-box protein [Planctomycetaceae bacterium]
MPAAITSTAAHEHAVSQRADGLFHQNQSDIYLRTDRLFAGLMVLQWIAGIAAAAWISPNTWAGAYSETHLHVWSAIFLGGLITLFPVCLVLTRPGSTLTRHVIAISQMLTSALFIHLSGGRIEAHFHVFGSLAFLACYRDWRVLVSATLVVAADHFVRGIYFPQSVFGVLSASPWRSAEHAAWVMFENIFLTISIRQSVQEMKAMSRQRAKLEVSNNRLSETKERYIAIFENVVDAIITISLTGTIEEFNSAAEKMFGYSAEEVLGKNVSLLMPSPFREEHDGYLARYLKTGKKKIIGFGREAVGTRKDGTTIPVNIAVSEVILQMTGTSESRRLYTGIIRDLSEVKENIELKRAKAELVDAKEAADVANQAKSEFLANMSHEIRTPMTAILGFTDILVDNVTGPENIAAARTVKENGEYLIELINDILDLSKIEAGKFDVEQIDCSPHEIIANVFSLMKVRAAAKGLPLEVRIDGPIPETICTDPTRLRQILINLLGNAIKFTETGSVELVTRLLNGASGEPELQFNVIDTGIGISDDKIETLFQPFTQADSSTTRQFGGTGLGLTICKRMAELLGGRVSVSSKIGEGSTFSVTVSTGPLESVRLIHDVVPSADESVVQAMNEQTETLLHKCRVLLVEDGPSNQRLISYILNKAGAEVTVAENGQVAIDKVHAEGIAGAAYDVILMDMQMPILDGYDATRQLRQEGFTGTIIALTAHAMVEDRQKCFGAGCDDFTSKPIDRCKLIAMIKTHFKGEDATPTGEQPAAVLFSELTDDEDMLEIVEMFVDEMPDKIAAIEAAIAENDLATLGVLVHRMKGAAGGYGFPTVTEAARLADASVKAGEEWATIVSQARAVVDLCRRIRSTAPAV